MFIQFDRINRHQTKPQTRRAKAVSDDGTGINRCCIPFGLPLEAVVDGMHDVWISLRSKS